MSKQTIHEEILVLIENSRGELKSQVMKLTNAKNPRLCDIVRTIDIL